MNKQIHIGCNGLIIEGNKLLLGIRKNSAGEGTYGLPGGHLEYGEKIEDAIKRELKEETSIDVTKMEFASIIDEAGEPHYLQVNFLVKKYDGKIQCTEPDKCDGWEWFALDNLPNSIFPPHIPIIEAYINRQVFI